MLFWRVLNRTEPGPHSFPFTGTSPVCSLATSLRPYLLFPKPFPVISFADPDPITALESYRFKNGAGRHSRHF